MFVGVIAIFGLAIPRCRRRCVGVGIFVGVIAIGGVGVEATSMVDLEFTGTR